MKKLFSLALAMVLLLNVGLYASAAGKTDKQKAIDYLISNGWTQSDIDDLLSDEALLVFADAISCERSEKKYFRVTETDVIQVSKSEFDAGVAEAKEIIAQNEEIISNRIAAESAKNNFSSQASVATTFSRSPVVTTTDGYMEYYVEENYLGNGKYAVGARFEWLIEPEKRRIDAFGLGHDGTLSQTNDPVYYVYKTDLTMIDQWGRFYSFGTYETTTPTSISVGTGGVGITQDLYDDDVVSTGGLIAENHRGYLQYNVTKCNTYDQTGFISADYKHQQNYYSVTPTVSYPLGVGLTITHSTFFKTMSPNPYLQFAI